jgi:hypothetical protein
MAVCEPFATCCVRLTPLCRYTAPRELDRFGHARHFLRVPHREDLDGLPSSTTMFSDPRRAVGLDPDGG